VVAAICITLGVSWAQDAAPKKDYKPTEIQSLKLKVAQQDALLAQKDVQAAQARLNAAMTALGAEANAVKKENGWPDDTNFNPDSLTFVAPAPAPPAAKVK
jgi:hypothetical protein